MSTSNGPLGSCEPDLTELHMLISVPEIVLVLHGQPSLRRTAKRLGEASRYFRADTARARQNAIRR
jgi:hypothetical protein